MQPAMTASAVANASKAGTFHSTANAAMPRPIQTAIAVQKSEAPILSVDR